MSEIDPERAQLIKSLDYRVESFLLGQPIVPHDTWEALIPFGSDMVADLMYAEVPPAKDEPGERSGHVDFLKRDGSRRYSLEFLVALVGERPGRSRTHSPLSHS